MALLPNPVNSDAGCLPVVNGACGHEAEWLISLGCLCTKIKTYRTKDSKEIKELNIKSLYNSIKIEPSILSGHSNVIHK